MSLRLQVQWSSSLTSFEMRPPESTFIVAAATGFVLSVVLTPAAGMLARRVGAVAHPNIDRWHKRSTPMLGGVAIILAVLGSFFLFVPHARETTIVLAAGTSLFFVGLVDDFVHLAPYQKLIGQLVAAAAVTWSGLTLPWTAFPAINGLISMFWLVGMTNALNMLDNMDGLAAGVSAIAAAFLSLNFHAGQQWSQAVLLLAFAGTLLGFLIYNHHPASIFMGDCGSMFVGFLLAGSVLTFGSADGYSRTPLAVQAVPLLVLVVPIFDTTLVTLMRKLAGRPASQGGRDHTSHRLVALGLSEKHAVWVLYAFAIVAGSLATFVRKASPGVSLGAIAAFVCVLTILGVGLARVRVYDVSGNSS